MSADQLEDVTNTGDSSPGDRGDGSGHINLASITELPGVWQSNVSPSSGKTKGDGTNGSEPETDSNNGDVNTMRSQLFDFIRNAHRERFRDIGDIAPNLIVNFNKFTNEEVKDIVDFVDTLKKDQQAGFAKFDKIVEHNQCDPDRLVYILQTAQWELERKGLLDSKTEKGYEVSSDSTYLANGQYVSGRAYITYSNGWGVLDLKILHEIPITGCG